MELVLALLIGTLTAASVWLMLSRNLVRFLFGLVLIGNVANLSIFTVGGLTAEAPPFVVDGVVATVSVAGADAMPSTASGEVANPLPQALVLTAIVIGFGLTSFMLVLALRAWRTLGTVDVDEMCLSESGPNPSGTSAAAVAADRADAAAAAADSPGPAASAPRAAARTPAREPAE